MNINVMNINKMLQELQKSPYLESHVTHKITNKDEEEISVSYSRSAARFRLQDRTGQKVKHFNNIEETAAFLEDFINN
ncbi:hypothetical protein [Bacillus sp. T33-2]|uniref:hypothetical protein n=1 Tax=Bacillus sp. T33-2 TaxID=2054168 RepID=UPI000C7752B5|nr:hypothetical protein [Bacillus sp. T33-2]PLR91144.1 hypothetical protein CVD19_21965 [Bacillus sp. T33-2]